MVRWVKLFGRQYLGFWVMGLVLFAIQEIPYMVMPLFELETNPIMNMQESSVVLNVCEKILGSLCIAIMTFVVHEDAKLFSLSKWKERFFFGLAMGTLLLNFLGWGLYFNGHQGLMIMMIFIVALPPLYYIFVGLWRKNIILTTTGIMFLCVHFIHTYSNLTIGIV